MYKRERREKGKERGGLTRPCTREKREGSRRGGSVPLGFAKRERKERGAKKMRGVMCPWP
jgi:hypothetical protein